MRSAPSLVLGSGSPELPERLRAGKFVGDHEVGDRRQARVSCVTKLVDHDGDAGEHRTARLDEILNSGGLAAALDPVVDEQEAITGLNRLALNLQDVLEAAVVGLCLDLMLDAREERALLADRDEPHPERECGCTAEEEPT